MSGLALHGNHLRGLTFLSASLLTRASGVKAGAVRLRGKAGPETGQSLPAEGGLEGE